MTQPQDNHLDPALKRIIAVVLLGGITGILDGSMVAVAVDTLASDFNTTVSTISWVSTSYLLSLTIAVPVTAWAADRFGDRRTWMAGLALFLLGSVLCGLAWNVGSLIVFRVLQGFGAGILDPMMPTLLARSAGPSRAGRVMGLMGVVGSFGPVLGPIAGGLVLQSFDWRWMFLVNVPIVVISLLCSLRVLPADPPAHGKPRAGLDLTGLALLGPGAAAVILALSQAAHVTGHGGLGAWRVWVPLAAGAALVVGYVLHARRIRATPPLIDLQLFTERRFAASVAVMALVGVAMFSGLFVLPLYYQQAYGYGALAAALLLAPFGAGGALAMPLAGRLSDRFGSRALALAGGALTCLATLTFTGMDGETSEVWPALAAFTIGLGLGCVAAPTMGSLYRVLPAARVSQGSSALFMLNQLGASVGIAVVALIWQTADDPVRGFHTAYWWVSAAVVVLLGAASLLPGRTTVPPATGGGGRHASDGPDVTDTSGEAGDAPRSADVPA